MSTPALTLSPYANGVECGNWSSPPAWASTIGRPRSSNCCTVSGPALGTVVRVDAVVGGAVVGVAVDAVVPVVVLVTPVVVAPVVLAPGIVVTAGSTVRESLAQAPRTAMAATAARRLTARRRASRTPAARRGDGGSDRGSGTERSCER